jgi:hypothetical protein
LADTKISAETAANALDGTELVLGVQGGANVKITGAQIRTYAQANLGTASLKNLAVGTSAPGSPSVNDLWADTN